MIKIAICDDEQLVRDYIENILRRKYGDGIVISHYEKAESLLEAWEQADNREDIVLMDIRLTQMDGISAAQNLQEKHHNVKIIFITGYIDYATEIFRAEPIYFLIKPVREEKLIEAVEKAKAAVGELVSGEGTPRERTHRVIRNIAAGCVPAKQDGMLCLRLASGQPCSHPGSSCCLGCGYEIYTKAAFYLLVQEYALLVQKRNLSDGMQRERYTALM